VAVPGASATTPPPTAVTPQTGTVAPQSQIPTKEEISPAKPPVEVIQIGGAGAPKATDSAKPQAAPTPPERGVTGVDSNSTVVARPVEPVSGALSSVAKTFGEDVVPAGGDHSGATAQKPIATAAVPAGMKQYTAVPGDSLSKIASKTMGSSKQANRDAIIAANPSLQQNANMVIAGKTYNIPAGGSSAPAPTSSTPAATPVTPTKISIVADKPPVAAEPQGNVYTVKAGDSLTKIAVEQCGTAGAVNAIIDLNKDALKGGTTIHPNMKLRLPSKPVATAE
jgi:LysM repeat protein